MKNWMRTLGLYYETMRALYPDEKLLIVFDIDGTIIDMRYMVLDALRKFDKISSTGYFKNLELSDIYVDENTIGRLLIGMKLPLNVIVRFQAWYSAYRTSPRAILESHKPFKGVMEVIKWFQERKNTCVALNTGRPENIRGTTLKLLNTIGKDYDVSFKNELLYMNPYDWNTKCTGIKAEGMEYFKSKGYKIFAFIDNEPENLKSVHEKIDTREILLLHASTIYNSSYDMLPKEAVSGNIYDLDALGIQ